jgi:prophage DNA circulation protein
MAWQDDLQPASWRGAPFYVESASDRAGRFTAPHSYPMREDNPVWVEDLGLAAFPTRIVGFLIGDDIADQRQEMLAAVQQSGQGELVHPHLGSLTGSIIDGCEFTLRRDRGRYIEIGFLFLENAETAPYPDAKKDTSKKVDASAGNAQAAAAGDWSRNTKQGTSSLTTRSNLPSVATDPRPVSVTQGAGI